MTNYQILKATGCYVGKHTWIWTAYGTRESEPPPYATCNCGQYTWQNRDEAEQMTKPVEKVLEEGE